MVILEDTCQKRMAWSHISQMAQESETTYDSSPKTADTKHRSFAVVLLSAISFLAGTVLLILVVVVGPFAWILRDGLGPDAVNSTWLPAVHRVFWTFYWEPSTIASALGLVGSLFFRRFIDRSANEVGKEKSKTT